MAEAVENPWIVSVEAISLCTDGDLVRYEIELNEIYPNSFNDHPFIEIGGDVYALDYYRRGDENIFHLKYYAKRNSMEKFRYGVSFSTPATGVTYFALEDGTTEVALGGQKDYSMEMYFPDTPFCEGGKKYFDRKVLVAEGDVMVYVNFPFEVPRGSCGQVQVREFQQGLSRPRTSGYWKLLAPGTMTQFSGIYWFRTAKTNCSPIVEISGEPLESEVYGQWSGLEVKPIDIGLLSTIKKYKNVFRLNGNNRKFSYFIVFNPHGYKTNLGTIINDPINFNMHCKSAGVIVPDQRGFLYKAFMWGKMDKRQQKAFLKDTIIDCDDIFVNICREQ